MPSIRKLYNHIQKRRRSKSRSRSSSPSTEDPTKTMSDRAKAECRECQLGLFCYDHVERTAQSDTPEVSGEQQPEAISKQNQPGATDENDTPVSNDQPLSQAVFETSDTDDGKNDQPVPRRHSQQQRDPSLPQIKVNGVEIPYWVK
jgi:hypothetical protein